MDEVSEIEELVRKNPNASAMYALSDLHAGRLDWLARHIEVCEFTIDPAVAKKLLALITCSEDELFFEMKLVRRSDLAPGKKPPQERVAGIRNGLRCREEKWF